LIEEDPVFVPGHPALANGEEEMPLPRRQFLVGVHRHPCGAST
jgi:hypothetical protein